METNLVNLKNHPLLGTSIIDASAGTGKTFTITHLYIRFILEQELEVNQILVVTFTNAATQELKGRIRDLIEDTKQFLTDTNIKNESLELLFKSFRGKDTAVRIIEKAQENFDKAAIFSIHSFCQRVLTLFPLETKSLLKQKFIEDENAFRESAIKDYWRTNIIIQRHSKLGFILSFWASPQELLNDVQPLLGFENEIRKYKNQKNQIESKKEIHSLWKTISDYWEKERNIFLSILEQNPVLSKVTYKPVKTDQLFKEIDELIALDLPYKIPESWNLLTKTQLQKSTKKAQSDERFEHDFFDIAEVFSKAHQEWLVAEKKDIVMDASNYVSGEVERLKNENYNLSFDDLIHRVSQVASNRSFTSKVTKLYPVAMVDEFQDTDHKQYSIFSNLYINKSDEADDLSLIMIGDPKQAIYRFRGADVFTYQQAKQQTQRKYTLVKNYRSSSAYVNLINRFFTGNENAFIFKNLIDFKPAKAILKKEELLYNDESIAEPLVTWIYPFKEKASAKTKAENYFSDYCAQEVFELLRSNNYKLNNKGKIEAKDIAILVKTGRQAIKIKKALATRGISSALILRESVFCSEQAREINCLLDTLIDSGNNKKLYSLLATDLFCWRADEIYNLQNNNQQLIKLLEQIKKYHRMWKKSGILAMFFEVLTDQKSLDKNILDSFGTRKITNWLHIVELLQAKASQHGSFTQVVNWLQDQRYQAVNNHSNEAEEHQLRLESDSDLVRIVTVHKSKGLEYPIVFLPFMWSVPSQRKLPDSYSYHDDEGYKHVMLMDESQRTRWHKENLAEEMRLLYVAMTRAKFRCYLAWGHISGAANSAVANCLYENIRLQSEFPKKFDGISETDFLEPFNQLNCGEELVHIKFNNEKISDDIIVLSNGKKDEFQAALKISRSIKQDWQVSSYSKIVSTAKHKQHNPLVNIERTHLSILDKNMESLTRFNFPKGAKPGNFLHDILEHQIFNQPIDQNNLEKRCLQYGYELKWLPCLTEWLVDILKADIDGFSLSELMEENKLSEMEFLIATNKVRSKELNYLLQKNHYLKDGQNFESLSIKGYLTGFIDLVFKRNGQYFVADYKSNYLGPSRIDYSKENCGEAMLNHNYHLQYLIYTLALHRYLKNKIKKYNYDKDIGGVYYLFLRGLSSTESDGLGVYYHKPSAELIEQLDSLFGYE